MNSLFYLHISHSDSKIYLFLWGISIIFVIKRFLFVFEHFTVAKYLIIPKFCSAHAHSARFNLLTSMQSTSPQINTVHYCVDILSTTFMPLFIIYAIYLTSSVQLQWLTILKPRATSHLTSHVAKYTLFSLITKPMLTFRHRASSI
jgi:hypothetical protein